MYIFVDIFIIILCVVVICFCYHLNKKIHSLKSIKTTMSGLMEEMITITGDLEKNFQNTKKNLEYKLEKINDKIEEGAMLIECMDEHSSQLQKIFERSKQSVEKETIIETGDSKDPLEDIEPKGLGRTLVKSNYIIPGEEYI